MGCAESVPVESPAEVDRSAKLLLEWRGSTLGAAPVRFAPSSMTKWRIAFVKATVDESHLQCTISGAVDRVGSPTAYGGGQAVNLCTVWCMPEVGAKSSSALALKVTGARGTWAQVGMCPPSTAHGDSLIEQKHHVAMSSGNDGRLHVNGIVKNYDLPKFDEGNDVLLEWRRSSADSTLGEFIGHIDGVEQCRVPDIPAHWCFAVGEGGKGGTVFLIDAVKTDRIQQEYEQPSPVRQ